MTGEEDIEVELDEDELAQLKQLEGTEEINDNEQAYSKKREEAKKLFMLGEYEAAYFTYEQSARQCAFKDQLVTLKTNMAMCSIKGGKYERAFKDCQQAL